jgi:hypothetical protein
MTCHGNSLSHHKDEALLMSRTLKSIRDFNSADKFIKKVFSKEKLSFNTRCRAN